MHASADCRFSVPRGRVAHISAAFILELIRCQTVGLPPGSLGAESAEQFYIKRSFFVSSRWPECSAGFGAVVLGEKVGTIIDYDILQTETASSPKLPGVVTMLFSEKLLYIRDKLAGMIPELLEINGSE